MLFYLLYLIFFENIEKKNQVKKKILNNFVDSFFVIALAVIYFNNYLFCIYFKLLIGFWNLFAFFFFLLLFLK
jgi:hypothetical protein